MLDLIHLNFFFMNKYLILLSLISGIAFGQSYAPAPGQPGSTAIHMDSSIFVDWAANVSVTRGPMNILNSSAGLVSYGTDQTVIQRYLTTQNENAAKKSIWTGSKYS